MDDRQRKIERARSNAARRAKRIQLLGVENPSCAICGYNRNPASLEAHHIAGEANQELSVLLCRTCHDDLSDTAIDTLGELRLRCADREPLEVLAALMQGLADFLQALVDSLRAWALWCRAASPFLKKSLGVGWWKAIPFPVPR
jgi:hypothetical protein